MQFKVKIQIPKYICKNHIIILFQLFFVQATCHTKYMTHYGSKNNFSKLKTS